MYTRSLSVTELLALLHLPPTAMLAIDQSEEAPRLIFEWDGAGLQGVLDEPLRKLKSGRR